MKKLKPNRGQAILVPVDESEQTYGNIIIPDMGKTKATHGVIVDIRDIYNFNLGVEVESIFKIGDTVLFPSLGSQQVTVDRVDYFICGVQDLMAAIYETEE